MSKERKEFSNGYVCDNCIFDSDDNEIASIRGDMIIDTKNKTRFSFTAGTVYDKFMKSIGTLYHSGEIANKNGDPIGMAKDGIITINPGEKIGTYDKLLTPIEIAGIIITKFKIWD